MVASSRKIADTLWHLRDWISTNTTDPISASRPAPERFVMTSYPSRAVTYPIVTIKDLNTESLALLGLQSEAMHNLITMEIRIWGRNIKERDQISDEILDELRTNQIGATGTLQANDLHDFRVLSRINIDEDSVKSKVMTIRFLFVDS